MIKKSTREVRDNLTDLMNRIELLNETIVIMKRDKPKAKIVALTEEDLKNLEKDKC